MTTIDQIRAILANHRHAHVDGVLVDTFTASAIISVYDALGTDARTKMAAMPVERMGAIALKLTAPRN